MIKIDYLRSKGIKLNDRKRDSLLDVFCATVTAYAFTILIFLLYMRPSLSTSHKLINL